MGRPLLVNPTKFHAMFYKQRLPTKVIAQKLGVTSGTLDSFRIRSGWPKRGVSKVWNKKHPDDWNCRQCNKTFPNLTGHMRKFCSQLCRYAHMVGKPHSGSFKNGELHWNYQPDRSKIIDRHKSKTIWTYAQRNTILKRDKHICQICEYQFPNLPFHRLRHHGVCIDHIVAIRLGGIHDISNGQLLCSYCEKEKTHSDKIKILHPERFKKSVIV